MECIWHAQQWKPNVINVVHYGRLKRPEWEEINKLKGTKFKVLLKLTEENIQLKKKEFSHFCKDVKTNPAKAIVDKKFSKLAAFFHTVILMF